MRQLAIDFGTSNTIAALMVDGQAARTVTFDASPLLPSAVFIAADGQAMVGREAQRQARLDPSRYEPNPKRRIDDGEVLLGDRVVPVTELIAAVLRTVAAEVRRQLGGAMPDEVRLTHPAQWGSTRQKTLFAAAQAAGLGTNLVLIPEPVAAAAQYTQLPGRTLPPGGAVAIYDLGGGTFDVAVVGRSQQEFQVLAEGGLADLGGLDFDQAVLDHVGRVTSSSDPGRWQQILRPSDASTRRAARALAEDVRAAKETLSRYPQTEVALPDPFVDAHLTRSEFEGLIRPNMMRSVEVLSATLRNAGVRPDQLTGVFLVGGSSRIPLVAKLIQEQLGITPVALDQPETAVALGALLVPTHREAGVGLPSGAVPTLGQYAPQSQSQPQPQPHQFQGPVPAALVGQVPQAPTPASAPAPASAQRAAKGSASRRPLMVGAGVAALLAAITVLFVVIKPFSTDANSGQNPDPTTQQTSSASSSAPITSTPITTSDVRTQADIDFMGPTFLKTINCGDNTSGFNQAVKEPNYQGKKVIRCEAPEDAALEELGAGRVLVYSIELESADKAKLFIDQIWKDRSTEDDTNENDKNETDGGSRYVAVSSLPVFGGGNDRTSVLAWTLGDQSRVGVLVTPNRSTYQDNLVDYWAQLYKPRG